MLDARVQRDAPGVRCPLCLGELDQPPGGDQPPGVSSCPDCATTYHAACVKELEVPCATLGCARGPKPPDGRLTVAKRPPPARRPARALVALLFVTPLVLGLGLVLAGGVTVTRVAPAPTRVAPAPTRPPRRDRPAVRLPGAPAGRLPGAEEARAAFLARGATISVGVEPPRGASPGRLLVPRGAVVVPVEVPAEVYERAVGSDPAPTRSVRVAWLDERSLLMAARGGVLREALLCDLEARRVVALLDLSEPW